MKVFLILNFVQLIFLWTFSGILAFIADLLLNKRRGCSLKEDLLQLIALGPFGILVVFQLWNEQDG